MYLSILKRDIKRKRAMNAILLIFITLATAFVSSSVNNILSVTSSLDDYFEMSNAPDYFFATMNKSSPSDIDEALKSAESINGIRTENILYLSDSNIYYDNGEQNATMNTRMLQSDGDMALNYFLDDGSILEGVAVGEVYVSSHAMAKNGLAKGDRITFSIGDKSRELTVAGGIKDAVFGSSAINIVRFIVNENDHSYFTSDDSINTFYGGGLYYIDTSDIDKTLAETENISDDFIYALDREGMSFSYVFDMIITGILLVVSVILITISFVVLRFTIAFTLSEEFREIGVMKAIGISSFRIRTLYLVKYSALAAVGAFIGLFLGFPIGKMLTDTASCPVIISRGYPFLTSVICAAFVVAIILVFCYGCTRKVKSMTPVDAIRNGQTGERFRKKSSMSLAKSKLSAGVFLALNDIVCSPRRYGIIALTFFLCLSLMLMLSATVATLGSDTLIKSFGIAHCHLVINANGQTMYYMTEGGREKIENELSRIEHILAENGMEAECYQDFTFNFRVTHGDKSAKIPAFQGTGTTMDMYEYTSGTAPQKCDEIAITRIAADMINANIGDTVNIKTSDGDKQYIITAFFQAMNMQGAAIRFFTDEQINYVQAMGCIPMQIRFTDSPGNDEVMSRLERINDLLPEFENNVITCAEFTKQNVGVVDALSSICSLVTVLTVILSALITVLMERSFIARERSELALMKAIGTKNSRIYVYHTLRFLFVGIIAVIIGEILSMPLTHLCIDPVFKMMGMELSVDYVIDPVEAFIVFPCAILATTTISAFLTSLYTRRISASDTYGIE